LPKIKKNQAKISFFPKMTDISSTTQNQIFVCEHCPRSFKKRNKLARHVKETHLNLKEFTCTLCSKSFKRNSHLKRHMVTHSTEPKPFKCLYNDCLLRFSDKYHLERHIKVKHKNIKFECKDCGLSFEKKLFLFKHNFQSHKQEKPFKCFHNHCTKSFYTKGSLAKHLKHHEFPFKKRKMSNNNHPNDKNNDKSQCLDNQNNEINQENAKKKDSSEDHMYENLKEINFIFEKILDYHDDNMPIPEKNKEAEIKAEDFPEKIYMDFEENLPILKEEEKDLGLENDELFKEQNTLTLNQKKNLKKAENEKIKDTFHENFFHENFHGYNGTTNNFQESKKENDEDKEKIKKENCEIKNFIDGKKKQVGHQPQNNYVFACMEPNCCKTYSTVKFLFSFEHLNFKDA